MDNEHRHYNKICIYLTYVALKFTFLSKMGKPPHPKKKYDLFSAFELSPQ
jgi:hypothetical protein